ncbi:hypothetical protein BBP40_010958, partial [Aspergillus hancockii]
MDVRTIAQKIGDGARLQWVGVAGDELEALIVEPGGSKSIVSVFIDTDEESMPQLMCEEPGSEMLSTTVLPRSGILGELRWASVHGVNVETDVSATTGNAFPLPESRVISLAAWCSCGYRLIITTEKGSKRDCIVVRDSRALVERFCDEMSKHMPMWLVGWNSYAFDNYCMLIHASENVDIFFERTVTRSAFGNRTGYILNIPGVYNVDLYVYLDRTQRERYPQLSLGAVAKQLGAPAKTHMPGMTGDYIDAMLDYNMNDSRVTALLWDLTGASQDIPNLACVLCAPVWDCVRYVTGVMSATVIASECLARGICFCWAKCLPSGKYQGG